jgi:CheY-like chemotaxis protein
MREPLPSVLVVDDTEANLDLLVNVLEDDYDVMVATMVNPPWSLWNRPRLISSFWIS